MYVGHTTDDHSEQKAIRQQPLLEHLQNTAKMAGKFAASFGAEGYGYLTGLLYDIGKYSQEAQKRMLYGGPKVDHATAGAWVCANKFDKLAAYCVAGHHTGLPNGGNSANTADAPTLYGRLLKAKSGKIPDFSAYQKEISFTKP